MTVTRHVTIGIRNGMHARPVAELVRLTSAHTDTVMLRAARGEADLRSVLAVMDLAIAEGDEVVLETADSPAAERLLDDLVAVLAPTD